MFSMFSKKPSNYIQIVFVILSFLLIFRLGLISSLDIPVCCPFGYVLSGVEHDLQISKKYECIPKNISKTNISTFVEIDTVQGYQIIQVNVSTVPQCEKQILIKFSEEVHLSAKSCLIKLNNELYAISCPFDENKLVYDVNVIKKCCPFGYVYDSYLKKCIKKDYSLNYYEAFFDHPIVLNDDRLTCKQNQVIVEYKLHYKDFKLNNGYLIVTPTNQRFHIDEFCMEGVVNASSEVLIKSEQNPKKLLRFILRVCDKKEICNRISCIRKCCEDNEVYIRINGTSLCVPDETDIGYHSFESYEFSGQFNKPTVFGVLRGLDCKKYKLSPDPEYPDDDHIISDDDGSIFLPFLRKTYDNNNYCVEKTVKAVSSVPKLLTFVCFEDVGKDALKFSLYSVGCLISCVFYALTLLVYLSIPKLRNLPGKILICLVASLFTAYLGIAITQITPPNDNICAVCAFCIYFSLMAAFSWMNVMCYDIWQTFGSARRSNALNEGQTKKFMIYLAYGWGLPSILTIITLCLSKFNILSDNLRPKFGQGRCWFQYTLSNSQLIFFSGPVGVLFLINFVLFLLTLRYCNRVKREIFRMQSSNMEKPVLRKRFFIDKARFMMNTKLFIVMGITWLLELISIIFYDRKRTLFWLLSDAFNVFLGVIVFFIFAFKKRIWLEFLVRLGFKSRDSLTLRIGVTTYATNSTCPSPNLNLQRMKYMESNSSLLSPASAAIRRPS